MTMHESVPAPSASGVGVTNNMNVLIQLSFVDEILFHFLPALQTRMVLLNELLMEDDDDHVYESLMDRIRSFVDDGEEVNPKLSYHVLDSSPRIAGGVRGEPVVVTTSQELGLALALVYNNHLNHGRAPILSLQVRVKGNKHVASMMQCLWFAALVVVVWFIFGVGVELGKQTTITEAPVKLCRRSPGLWKQVFQWLRTSPFSCNNKVECG